MNHTKELENDEHPKERINTNFVGNLMNNNGRIKEYYVIDIDIW